MATTGASLREFTRDVSTRAAAQAWLGRRVRKIGLLALVGVGLTPVASAIVVGVTHVVRSQRIPAVDPWLESSLGWSAIVAPLLLISSAVLATRYIRFARRARPIVRSGVEQPGRVLAVQTTTRQGTGGVRHHKISVTVQADRRTFVGHLEESEGTDLPSVAVGARATIWTLHERSIIATSGTLLEA